MKIYSSPINIESISALNKLLECNIQEIYSSQLNVDIASGLVSALDLSFWLDGHSSNFVNVFTDWIQTELEDYHRILVEHSETPSNIPFENKGIGPVSTYSCKVGLIERIEIIQSTFKVFSLPGDSQKQEVSETIEYDRVINIFGNEGCISLSTEFGPILGDIKIRNYPISGTDDIDESMVVRQTLSKDSSFSERRQ